MTDDDDRLRADMIAALPGVHPWHEAVDTLLPIVTAYAERRAATIVARVKAIPTYKVTLEDKSLGYVVIADDVLDALAADDRDVRRTMDGQP